MNEMTPTWALEHLATKADFIRLENKFDSLSDRLNNEVTPIQIAHGLDIKSLKERNAREDEFGWRKIGWSVSLLGPTAAFVVWLIVQITKK